MKRLIILSTLLITSISLSQNLEMEADYELQGYLKNYKEFNLEKLKEIKFKNIRELDSLRTRKKYSREIDLNVIEELFEIKLEFNDEKSVRSLLYNLRLFKEDGIPFALIVSEDLRERRYFYFDEIKLYEYIEKHNRIYNSNNSMKDFIDDTKFENVYSYACGFSVAAKKIPSNDGYKFNDKKNIEIFRKWLYSFNVENQNYGIDALEYLNKKHYVQLSANEKKAIEHIKNRNSIVVGCSGCEMGIYEKRY